VVTKRRFDLLMGNHALAYGAYLSRVQVVSAYPITPQTQVVELLAEMCADGRLAAEFIKVESEHSALAACIGASITGARAFTATSAQGLALMHEMLHWAVGSRLPIVMGNINRAMGPPWNVWNDQTDSLAQRDTGWMQIYAADNQEVLDSTIQAFRVAEQVMLPCMVVLDAFLLSHTGENVEIPPQEKVDRYLPPYDPPWRLDVEKPCSFGNLTGPDGYFELRYKIAQAHDRALTLFEQAGYEYGELFGRRYGLIETYRLEDAALALVTAGALAGNLRLAVDRLREEGIPAGSLRIRVFRPFPAEAVRTALRAVKRICVIDRNLSFGFGGIFAQELRAVLFPGRIDGRNQQQLFGFVSGLGGRDITVDDVYRMGLTAWREKLDGRLVLFRGLKGYPEERKLTGEEHPLVSAPGES